MGSPDPMQIDGMGGTYSSTSKVMVIEPGPGDAVTYWFAQIGIDDRVVDWSGNCGNLTTAIAPFAIDEGLVPVHDDLTRVRLVNGNTGVEICAEVHTLRDAPPHPADSPSPACPAPVPPSSHGT
ncbi:PrpF domain-containing protein [Microbacterium elymi]|uniref:Uncharacterized protein n=1 Tax=Microbacterium elymi TaxID=2909587 RepID=A0ABY5NHT4_9MICO|nr:PrpF domain-containing protein [Microbacterium elymi]UUT34671.1 hypothetical protein L2X98_29765 [Microbacterium elymi]